METDHRLVQFSKAPEPIHSMPSEMLTDHSSVQPAKALGPIPTTLPGIVILHMVTMLPEHLEIIPVVFHICLVLRQNYKKCQVVQFTI